MTATGRTPPHIRQLPPDVVNKIAAGEVVERPASVVKELMENSVDAGAQRVDVQVEGGGKHLVRVVDDGCGIAFDELVLAVTSHATSKISDADDLFHVRTLGFRGEALASIAAVSRLVVRSKPAEQESGGQVRVEGGKIVGPEPCAVPDGTCVEVRDLFFNTPVRRRFLRSVQTELSHVTEAFARIAVALPDVHFVLQHNDRVLYELPKAGERLERIAALYGEDLAGDLLPVESQDGPVRLSGYVVHPRHSRANAKMQFVFVNNRFVRDRALQHALNEAYRGLLTTGRYPICFLWLEMPPELVDVNVHPTKLEVRFEDGGRLYNQLLSTLRRTFLSMDLTVQIPVEKPETKPAADHAQLEQLRRQVVDWAKGQMQNWPSMPHDVADFSAGASSSTCPPDTTGVFRPKKDADHRQSTGQKSGVPRATFDQRSNLHQEQAEQLGSFVLLDTTVGHSLNDAEQPRGEYSRQQPEDATQGRPLKAMQVHDRYLVVEVEDGVLLIDQHALHERIIYEQLRERLQAGTVETQQLLVPEPVDLTPPETATALENRELLGELGILVEPFGGSTVLLCGYPAVLKSADPKAILQSVVQTIQEAGHVPDRRVVLERVLQTIACKAAIKAGDKLTDEEIESLLAKRHLIRDAHHCPHGRPAALLWSRRELDQHFRRV